MVGHGLEKRCSFRKIAMTMKEELLMVALGLQVKMEVCGEVDGEEEEEEGKGRRRSLVLVLLFLLLQRRRL